MYYFTNLTNRYRTNRRGVWRWRKESSLARVLGSWGRTKYHILWVFFLLWVSHTWSWRSWPVTPTITHNKSLLSFAKRSSKGQLSKTKVLLLYSRWRPQRTLVSPTPKGELRLPCSQSYVRGALISSLEKAKSGAGAFMSDVVSEDNVGNTKFHLWPSWVSTLPLPLPSGIT